MTCYEPWNRVSGKGLDAAQTPQDLVARFNLEVLSETDIFVLKETSIDFKGIQWLSQFLRANADTHRVQIVWSLRNYRHTYLSFVQGAREWWGHEKMTPSVPGYNHYMQRALKATTALLRLYQEFPGVIYAYEALTANPTIALPRLMGALDLEFSDQQLDYLQHFSLNQVRGDVSMSRDPRPISGDSVTKREAEWEHYQQQFADSSGDLLRQQLEKFWRQIECQILLSGGVPAAVSSRFEELLPARQGHEYREAFSSIEEWRNFTLDNPAILDKQRIRTYGRAIKQKGFSFLDTVIEPSAFHMVKGSLRDSFVHHGLSSRKRALLVEMFHDIRSRQIELEDARVYVPDAVGGFSEFLAGKIPHLCTSEYEPDPLEQENFAQSGHQDLAALTYPDASFDYVIVSDIFEYVSNLDLALEQIHRVLAPGGVLLSTFLFAIKCEEHQVVAKLMPDGRTQHPAKHRHDGDFTDNRGSRVHQIPGWNILKDCRSQGFSSADMVFLCSPARGVLANGISGVMLLKAVKAGG